jgi:hypothetical protein
MEASHWGNFTKLCLSLVFGCTIPQNRQCRLVFTHPGGKKFWSLGSGVAPRDETAMSNSRLDVEMLVGYEKRRVSSQKA